MLHLSYRCNSLIDVISVCACEVIMTNFTASQRCHVHAASPPSAVNCHRPSFECMAKAIEVRCLLSFSALPPSCWGQQGSLDGRPADRPARLTLHHSRHSLLH